MPSFSKRSADRLAQCHPDLQLVMNEAIKHMDFTVLCGHRGQMEQDKAYNAGNSTLKFPRSKHNKMPSLAVDIAPYPIDWDDIDRFKALGNLVLDLAEQHGIELVWGGNWRTLKDYPHFEVKQ